MNLKFLQRLLILLTILIGALLTIPEFTLGDFKFPSVGFSRIGAPVDFPSFEKGEGFTSSREYTAGLTFDTTDTRSREESATAFVNVIRRRIDFADLEGITVSLFSQENDYYIDLEIPTYYGQTDLYASWLVSSGDIGFLSTSGNQTSLTVEDVVDGISIVRLNSPVTTINGIAFRFDEILETELIATGSNLALTVDGIPTLSLITDEIKYSFNSGGSSPSAEQEFDELLRIGIVLEEQLTDEMQVDYLNIVRSYFLESDKITITAGLEEGSELLAQSDLREGLSLLAVVLIGSILITHYSNKRTKGLKSFAKTSLIFLAYGLITIPLLKLLQPVLDVDVIIALAIMLLIVVQLIDNRIQTIENDGNDRKLLLIVSLSLITISYIPQVGTVSNALVTSGLLLISYVIFEKLFFQNLYELLNRK